jgi:hypothetical protein
MLPALGVTWLGAATAAAQQAPGAAEAGPHRPASPLAAARLSMESAFDSVRSTSEGPHAGAAVRLRADLSHDRASRRGTLRLWAGVTGDQGFGGIVARSLAEAISVDGTVTLTRHTRVEVAERASWSPLDLFPVFGAADAESSRTVRSGSELQAARTWTQNGRVSLIRTLGRRSSATLTAGHATSLRAGDGVHTASAGGRVSRRIGSFGEWHGGYGFAATTFAGRPGAGVQRRHDVDVGVDYARPLPFSRHTTFALTTGSTMLVDGDKRYGRFNTTAGVVHRVTGLWSGRVDYTRPVQFVAGFTQPFLSDSVRLSAAGPLPRRLALTATAGYARGTLGARAGAAGFDSYTSVVRVTRRLGATWQWEAEYHDARYRFDRAPSADGSIPGRFVRRGARAGLVWSPVIGR